MITDYLIVVSFVATVSLVWRTLIDDFPIIKQKLLPIPFAGTSLLCGFCMPLWVTGFVTFFINPLESWHPVIYLYSTTLWPVVLFFVGWFSVGAGVLLLRNAIIILMEGGAVLKHRHIQNHNNEVK